MRNSVGLWLFRGAPRLTVMTMVLPTRRTLSMVAPVSASAMSASEDLKVCGLPLVQTLAMRWPWTRAWTPLAIVSTSGSSGMGGDILWNGLRGIGRSVYCLLSMKIMARSIVVLAGVTMMVAMRAGTAAAQGGSGPLLLVANQGDHTISLIDPVAGKEITAVPVEGITGHEVAATGSIRLI